VEDEQTVVNENRMLEENEYYEVKKEQPLDIVKNSIIIIIVEGCV
jgi:hypothetical protein